MTRTSWLVGTSTLGAGLLASLLLAQPAQACGGFFCNNSQPVNQAAERIIFSVAEDGTVTATIQIQYSGDAESFAWVLPVAGDPDVRVSSNLAFARLQAGTNPNYVLTTRFEGSCRDDGVFGGPRSFGAADASAVSDAAGPDAGSPITVVREGSVGPYDYIIITVDPMTPRPSDAAVTWLRDNEYQIDEAGAERLEPYLAGGMNLLAFRLTKGNSVGSIRPVQITFGAGVPSIPIRPTAVAAVADMGVMVWVLGPHRAVPVNYASLELNEALINWLSPGLNYNDVVIEAANQAGGQGFVTEFAGDAAPFADTVLQTWERDAWQAIRSQSWAGREGELINTVANTFGGWDGLPDAIRSTLPLPEGITYEELTACPGCYYPYEVNDIPMFEAAAFLASMETHVIEPMERTRELFLASPTMTRFYTTMSADEMTRDPAFDFNAALGDVSNTHNADRIIECSPSLSQFEAPWRVELPNGEVVRGTGTSWPFTVTDGSMPANARIRRLDTTGEGEVIVDNVAAIEDALTEHNRTVRPPSGGGGGGWLCSASGRSAEGTHALGLVALVGLTLALRRRSR